MRPYFVRDPFEVAEDAAIVRAVDPPPRRCSAAPPAHIGDTPWMDAALLQAAGIETVVCGAAGTGAHADVEWVDLESVVPAGRDSRRRGTGVLPDFRARAHPILTRFRLQ